MAEGVKAPATVAKAPATVDVATPHTAVDLVTPASDNVGQGDAHLVAAQGSGTRRQQVHKLQRLRLQQEIPWWQEKHQDKVQSTGRAPR